MNRTSRASSLFALLAFTAVPVLAAQGCSSSDDAATTVTPGTDAAADSAATVVTVTKDVGAEGGTVETSNGVKLEIPAGALPANTAITIETNTAAPAVDGTTTIGDTYKFKPEGITFTKPVRVTLPLPAGASTDNIVLIKLPTGATEWQSLGGLQEGATTVTGFTSSFSDFRLVQLAFAQAGCFQPTNCDLRCDPVGGFPTSCTGSCSVRGTSIAAGVQCAPMERGNDNPYGTKVVCICDGAQTGLTARHAESRVFDALEAAFRPAQALYEIATWCGWPCTAPGTDGGTVSDGGSTTDASTVTDSGAFTGDAGSCNPQLVISYFYFRGGAEGATYANDFVEIHNRSGAPINLANYSVQAATGTTTMDWNVATLSGTIAPGGYAYAKFGGDAGGGTALSGFAGSNSFNLDANGGRVAIVAGNTPITGPDPYNAVSIIDLQAYGSTYTPQPVDLGPAAGNPNYGFQRNNNGCQDQNQKTDFFAANIRAPYTSASTANECTCGSVIQ